MITTYFDFFFVKTEYLIIVLCLAKGEKVKKKKVVTMKRKNKINTEGIPEAYSQPVDLSTTFGEPEPLLPSTNPMQ